MRVILFFITMLTTASMNGQDLGQHQWKNRVILVLAENASSEIYKTQLMALEKQTAEVADRKLLIYQVLPDQYRVINPEKEMRNEAWIKSSILFERFASPKSTFKVILIGLDGGIKLQKNELLDVKELFNTIDSMPMRRAEMRKRKG